MTEDGREIEAYIHWYLDHQIKKLQKLESTPADWLQLVHQWKVYPRTEPLRFDLMQVKPLNGEPAGKNKQSQPATLDKFRVVGEIKAINEKKIIVRVRRNQKQPQSGRSSCNSIFLTLIGTIPAAEVGQIWELQVRRVGIKLLLGKAKVYEPSLKEIALFNRLTLQRNSVDTIESSASIPELDKVVKEAKVTRADQLMDLMVQKPQQKEGVNQNKKQKDLLSPILNLVTPQIEQQSGFTVKVNGQVFIGFNSVNLIKRMLCIDGKLVAQSKIAIVLGQPSVISADGSVKHGNNQSVLMSK